jgi:hypothetical protein
VHTRHANTQDRAVELEAMVSSQTAKLLDDRAALLADASAKDTTLRNLQAELGHARHQLAVALADRTLLLQQLRALAGEGAGAELAALTAAMEGGFDFADGGAGGASDAAGFMQRAGSLAGAEVAAALAGLAGAEALQALRAQHSGPHDAALAQLLQDEAELLHASAGRAVAHEAQADADGGGGEQQQQQQQ